MIYFIGDSHVLAYRDLCFDMSVHHVGSATAHNIWERRSRTRSRRKILKILKTLNAEDVVVTSFGEIDCGNHICYQAVNIEVAIEQTIERYGKALKWLKDQWPTHVYGVPPVPKGRLRRADQEGVTVAILTETYKKFNIALREKAKELCVGFLDVYNYAVNEKGFIKLEYREVDEAHLNKRAAQDMLRDIWRPNVCR